MYKILLAVLLYGNAFTNLCVQLHLILPTDIIGFPNFVFFYCRVRRLTETKSRLVHDGNSSNLRIRTDRQPLHATTKDIERIKCLCPLRMWHLLVEICQLALSCLG